MPATGGWVTDVFSQHPYPGSGRDAIAICTGPAELSATRSRPAAYPGHQSYT